jgi:phage-related protein
MATFPNISPEFNLTKKSAPLIRTTKLGDGYEFRALYGLPLTQDPKEYQFIFNVTETESDIIEAFLRSRVNDQASFTFTPPGEGSTQTGTYDQNGTATVTITIANHGLAIGDVVTIDYTSGSATDGDFVIATTADENTFTVTAASVATNSGNVSVTLSGAGKYVCDAWEKTIPYANRAIINCTFREVFEP